MKLFNNEKQGDLAMLLIENETDYNSLKSYFVNSVNEMKKDGIKFNEWENSEEDSFCKFKNVENGSCNYWHIFVSEDGYVSLLHIWKDEDKLIGFMKDLIFPPIKDIQAETLREVSKHCDEYCCDNELSAELFRVLSCGYDVSGNIAEYIYYTIQWNGFSCDCDVTADEGCSYEYMRSEPLRKAHLHSFKKKPWQEITIEDLHSEGFMEDVDTLPTVDFDLAATLNACAYGIHGDGIDVRCIFADEVAEVYHSHTKLSDISTNLEKLGWKTVAMVRNSVKLIKRWGTENSTYEQVQLYGEESGECGFMDMRCFEYPRIGISDCYDVDVRQRLSVDEVVGILCDLGGDKLTTFMNNHLKDFNMGYKRVVDFRPFDADYIGEVVSGSFYSDIKFSRVEVKPTDEWLFTEVNGTFANILGLSGIADAQGSTGLRTAAEHIAENCELSAELLGFAKK